MKKKSKDLTIEEVTNICHKLSCSECPFNVLEEDRCMTYFEVLNLDQEIEIKETENNICATCKLNNYCPLNHKPSLQCPYDDYKKKEV